MTSLVIISSGLWRGGLTGIELTTAAFEQSLPGFGAYFLPIAVFLFCYSTLISWYYYGERGVDYLFGASWCRVYKMIFLTLIIVGAMWKLDPILNFADSAFGLMVIPNVIAIVLLRKTVKKLSDDYFSRVRAGEFVELE